ncbi:histidine kinase [Mesorhizobium sp. RP14(2022)]|uniref:histidine kinase n=1 Tax=Mesorhizobium liriopis TaxID=2953882 RepID=A0ABT1C6L7_9HYPH|nr:histidine kinase [Mesorhizobium liriopis]MCO6050470.1 histidine kinase [Mesorhizobium liriopis]
MALARSSFRELPVSFKEMSLSARFALTGSIVMLLAAILIGVWVTGIIERNVVSSTASATALYMDSFITPLTQELEASDTLSIGPVRAIEESLEGSALGARVVSVKIWKPDGLIAYAEDKTLIGRRFPLFEELEGALSGRVVYEFDKLDNEESAAERTKNLPLLEIYSPIRKAWTGEVIAVVEFYENGTDLKQALTRARWQTGGIVGGAAALIGLALFGIVRQASGTIEQQRAALKDRIAEAERFAEQNRLLRLRVERASARGTELNERYLRRISADLHDGPAQLIGLAALRLDGLAKGRDEKTRLEDLRLVKGALGEAIGDIRDICSGLSLPEIGAASLVAVIEQAVAAHERRTGTHVALTLSPDLPDDASEALKICVFRFVQESLNNAYRHAGGDGQRIIAHREGDELLLVTENAPANDAEREGRQGGLGLSGLRERVESLGGHFSFHSEKGQLARTTMRIGLETGGNDDRN